MEDAIAVLTAIMENLSENVQLLSAAIAEIEGMPAEPLQSDIEIWNQQIAKYQGALEAKSEAVSQSATPPVVAAM